MRIRRKSTLRESLSVIRSIQKNEDHVVRLRGRYLFRASVRLVLEYINWIKGELSIIDPVINDDDDTPSLVQTQKATKEKHILNLQDRSILLIPPQLRSKQEKSHIVQLIRKLQAFKKYPDDLRDSVASNCEYQYVGPGRVIVRQNHVADNLYYIISGHIELTKMDKNNITGETLEINAGTLGRGDIFGEVALLHDIPRSITVTTKTPVDLLYVNKYHFNRLLKPSLMENWNVLKDALVTFNYFSAWDEATIRECCVISKIKDFPPNEILLGDGMGMVNYVYFLLSGNCRLIEHMVVLENKSCGNIKYKLYNPNITVISEQCSRRSSYESDNTKLAGTNDSSINMHSEVQRDYNNDLLNKTIVENLDVERMSVVTTTLQDVINQWHEITEVAAALMRRPSTLSQQVYPDGVRTIFMKICEFYRGACFGLGEEMQNRRIVSITPVRCLLVPRYWLLEHNRANIWERVKVFMNSKYPSRDQLFKQFVTNRRWMKYKKSLMNDIIRDKNIMNNTTIHDVPYSIRINGQFFGI